ncbi:hypothetical protein AB8R05_21240 [Klebsiella variicola]|jgi:hypothetical protein|uniref:hypothetical protein n=1 Tax=Klebsiella TaxID=570 RepID=UPI0007CCD803|nr:MULTISPECIES: hypothetical protein [Klebsiella]MCB3281132.1 hypothetical protein [Klebsiella pneumoniae]PLD48974.1 hypothetical protein B6I56_26485 [Klebsiella quasipneumoniae]QLS23633.1 hypothetical protein HV324_31620 [Klebsiella michiganensis]SAP71196.1 Uncharacterised protein [Klebsiella michiganensis]SLS74998.1 Uncharacterised protein [Klebsiella pneumoniae]
MKNQIYNRHGIYEIIRNHYIKNFPYTVQFEALNAINEHISLIIDDASIQKNEDNKYIFINNNTNKETDDPFESKERNLAAYLSRSSGIEALFQDVNALQKWLLQSGFISGGIATEKMLITNKL